jgi:hypothetical protein
VPPGFTLLRNAHLLANASTNDMGSASRTEEFTEVASSRICLA